MAHEDLALADLGVEQAEYHECISGIKTDQSDKRHYLFRFESVNQLVAFLTSVAPNWQRHSAKAGSLKNAKIPQTFWVFGLNEFRYN